MPDPDLVDLIDGLLKRLHVAPDQRALLYRQLLERQLTERAKAAPSPASDRIGSEFQPLEERDFLRRTLAPVLKTALPAKAAPAAPAKARAVKTARVVIYDLDSTIIGIHGQITKILERHLNTLGTGTRWDGHLATIGVQFKVTPATKEPSAAAKAASLPLDYPLYFIDELRDPSFSSTVARLHRIMDEHQIPEFMAGTDPPVKVRHQIQRSWGTGLRGVTVPPGIAVPPLFRKCIFFKGKDVAKHANGNAIFYLNSILHELGHAHNITAPGSAHPKDGSVMNARLSVPAMSIDPLPYNSGHLTAIMSEIGKLWGMQRP